ncbi:NADH-quinone oxidoreductase subunit NuoK [Halorubrum sp. AD140]|jgi:NADH-quinone oxidoreductase subunit K|uniref:NADH-quinone oxidoreductase subunit NuoK n=1 Tax=unclassified Halorubrum TaxID=2642239 RepID=UPI002ACD0660|nr:NADH-quinone oxidoreductase subunit NuoK [Halorubrum sp. AD140]MDZ5812154.1 NADH-quinone oxidoreductase subunit NuoK [Halorubrum sp. AD140]
MTAVASSIPPEWYLLLSAAVFCIGLFGVLTRRDALYFLMSVELMMNAANINFVAFALYYGDLTGQVFALFVIALAAAEVAIGIGIILVLYRNFGVTDVTVPTEMRW